jgi:hypothetical protein
MKPNMVTRKEKRLAKFRKPYSATKVGTCKSCGGPVMDVCCNAEWIKIRPEAAGWDWWNYCSNPECEHAYGEGVFQDPTGWIEYTE